MLIPIILVVVVLLAMLGFIFFKSSATHATAQPSDSSQVTSEESQPVKDFAPSLPMDQKSTIVIRLSDSSTMKYIVPKTEADTYIKNLPEGYTVVSVSK